MKLIKSAALVASLVSTALVSTVISPFTLAAEVTSPVLGQVTVKSANVTTQPSADENKQQLIAKLAQIKFFSAQFSQDIFDENGQQLQQGSGRLVVSKPNLVNWQTTSPDESTLISDGESLWFFDPFVEQVSVYSLASAISNTPILLLTSDDILLWQHYNVSKIDEHSYLIHANDENARVKTLELNFSTTSEIPQLSAFNILDASGQLSVIKLLDSNVEEQPEASLFQFTVPEGVYIDDQR